MVVLIRWEAVVDGGYAFVPQMTRLTDSACPHRLPAFFCRLCCPARGNLSYQNFAVVATFSGVRYNSDYHLFYKARHSRKVVCQQGCCSPLLETQSQRSYAPLDTPAFLSNDTHTEKLRFPMSDHFSKMP